MARETAFPKNAAAVVLDTDFSSESTIYVGADGDVSVVPWLNGGTAVFKGLRAGMVVPVQVRRVNAALTTATSMVRIWEL